MSYGAGLRAGVSAAGHLLRRVRRPATPEALAEALGGLRRLARMHRRRAATHRGPLMRRQTQQALHLWRRRRGARTRAGAHGGRVGVGKGRSTALTLRQPSTSVSAAAPSFLAGSAMWLGNDSPSAFCCPAAAAARRAPPPSPRGRSAGLARSRGISPSRRASCRTTPAAVAASVTRRTSCSSTPAQGKGWALD